MKIFKLFFIIIFTFSFNHLGANTDDMKIKITKNLRCLICQGQSVYDSDSEFANSLKVLVDKKLRLRGIYNATLKLEMKQLKEDIALLIKNKKPSKLEH